MNWVVLRILIFLTTDFCIHNGSHLILMIVFVLCVWEFDIRICFEGWPADRATIFWHLGIESWHGASTKMNENVSMFLVQIHTESMYIFLTCMYVIVWMYVCMDTCNWSSVTFTNWSMSYIYKIFITLDINVILFE